MNEDDNDDDNDDDDDNNNEDDDNDNKMTIEAFFLWRQPPLLAFIGNRGT